MRIAMVRRGALRNCALGALTVALLFLPSACRTTPRESTSAIPPAAWQRETDRWVGIPYLWGGTDRRGIDCSGFVQQVYARVARVDLPRTTREQFRVGRAVARPDLRPGDLVFFSTTGPGVSHVGVVTDTGRFAHASQSKGVTYTALADDYWTRRYMGARRLLSPPTP